MKHLFPSKDEFFKLKFEFWKWVLVSVLGLILVGVAGFFKSIRGPVLVAVDGSWEWLTARHQVVGWAVVLGGAAVLFVLLKLIRIVVRGCFSQKAVVDESHEYVRGEYDGVLLEWRWKGNSVDIPSMKGFCPICQTEVVIESHWNRYEGKETSVFCAKCNSSRTLVNVGDFFGQTRLKIEGDVRSGRWQNMSSPN